MVVLNKIYTRSGDDGTTALGNGERRKKFDLRVAAYGTVDETNACVGLARVEAGGGDVEIDGVLAVIQNDLFDLGADLATPLKADEKENELLRITDAQVERIENEIDRLNEGLDPLRSFVLPGGSPAAAHLHLARTTARRAERLVFQLAESEPVNPAASRYLNRISDFLFVAARVANDAGNDDVLWVPGRNR